MGKVIHARLDPESEELLRRLESHWGGNRSLLLRRALKALASITPVRAGDRFNGIGVIDSGKNDLGSNKRHLKGFGR